MKRRGVLASDLGIFLGFQGGVDGEALSEFGIFYGKNGYFWAYAVGLKNMLVFLNKNKDFLSLQIPR